ncbi:cofilin [Orbilia ellipsospora]|uniref:Cofilin n=1 Tax=Orbilia ellipsospora TaxID=2528407 RepID=A0AAV9XQQ9_9PEZI
MTTHISLNPECIPAFQDLQPRGSYKYILYTLSPAKPEIDILKKVKWATYADFLSDLPDDKCLYGVYSFDSEVEAEDKPWNKSLFVHWTPEKAGKEQTAKYGDAKINLYKELMGLGAHVEGVDKEGISEGKVRDMVMRYEK